MNFPTSTIETLALSDTDNWIDKGCELFPSCLNCPLDLCVEENPRGKQKFKLQIRSRQIKELQVCGKTTLEIASVLKVSQRTIQRALKGGGMPND